MGLGYRHLGRSGLRVSPLALGTMNFGPVTGRDKAHHILDRALDHDINLVGPEELGQLDDIFPGPGRAPEAYAW